MPYELSGMQYSTVAFVDEGANPQAEILLYKRKDDAGHGMKEPKGHVSSRSLEDLVDELADSIQKLDPTLTKWQAIEKAYSDRRVTRAYDAQRHAHDVEASFAKTKAFIEHELGASSGSLTGATSLNELSPRAALERVRELVTEMRKMNPRLSQEQATSRVYDEHPELYDLQLQPVNRY